MRLSQSIAAAMLAALVPLAAAGQTGKVEITEAWARATPAKAETGAAYATIVSPAGDRLVAVSTPVAKKAELHVMSMDGGVMKMREVDGVALPAGKPVTLKPGGYHIMLFGLTRPLEAGQKFPLTLTFEKGGSEEVAATVEKIGSMGPHAADTAGGSSTPSSPPNRH